jgi:hypothetical protein
VSVYALVGRERKSPYLINSVFSVFIICLTGVLFDLAAIAITGHQETLLRIGLFCLSLALVLSLWKMYTIWIRLKYFADPGGWRRLGAPVFMRRIRRFFGRQFGRSKATPKGQPYEFHPVPLTAGLQAQVREIIQHPLRAGEDETEGGPIHELRDSQSLHSLAIALRHQGQANEILSRLAVAFLVEGNYVQYLTASRHPFEFIEYLKAKAPFGEKSWEEVASHIIVIDAFTPHFGFSDSIHDKKSRQLHEFCVVCLPSQETYAGIHTAASRAFNQIKDLARPSGLRVPALLIYEDCFALSDLESVEQYRIFARHVMPSERMWDSMFTVFAETAQPDPEWDLISSYADMTLDLRTGVTSK